MSIQECVLMLKDLCSELYDLVGRALHNIWSWLYHRQWTMFEVCLIIVAAGILGTVMEWRENKKNNPKNNDKTSELKSETKWIDNHPVLK